MAYTPVNWTNTPTTPLDAENLNHMESGVIANELAAKKANEGAVCFSEALGKHTHTKNIYTAANWSLYNGITMTSHADGGYVSFNGTANTSSQTFLLSLDKSIKLDANKATFVLAKIRLRAVGANVTVSFRDDAFFNSTNVIATNAQTITGTWITDTLTDGEWRTIWAVTGGDKTITKLGVQPLPTTSDYELQVSSVDCYYSADGAEVADIITRLAAAEENISSLQTTTSANTANISDLQSTVNGSASTSGTMKNQIATAKSEIVEESINPLAERVTAAENNISANATDIAAEVTARKNADNSLGQRIGTAETDITQLKNRATTVENNISANAKNIKTATDTANANTANLSALTSRVTASEGNISNNRTDIDINTSKIADLQAYVGYNNDDILGLQVDYANKTFTRLAGAVGKNAGADFDSFAMYGGRRRCNVLDDGTITAYFGDENYAENGSNGQVMVYQPKFYYLVCPVVYDPIDTGIGYHLRKANYYVSEKAKAGFRLHPAFYDANGNELDYILISAYEGSIYDTSASAYLLFDEQVMTVGEDKFCSIAGVKPASGRTQNLTRLNIETMAQNRGANWHLENSKIASMEQLLCMIEMGTMNFQTAIGQGVVSITDKPEYNCASLTGSTASLGNGTGRATKTINEQKGVQTTETADGKTSVSYRGVENDWGNIFKFIIDLNIWGNGAMGGGEPFYCDDFNFAENKKTDNYKGVGFTAPNAGGYISAMGYSTACDWLFMASECLGNSSVPVGDYYWGTRDLNGYRVALLGGAWNDGANSGGFYWNLFCDVGYRVELVGGRLVYIPTARI